MTIQIGKYNIELSPEVLAILLKHRQLRHGDNEAGGILLGRIIGDRVSICRLSIPTELDKRTRTTFERHRISGQIIINYEFENSHGQIIYLGEWHTHPESSPSPSPRDLSMIQEQFKLTILNTNFVLLLIQGFDALYVGVFDKGGLKSSLVTHPVHP